MQKHQEIDSASPLLARPACARQVTRSPRSLCCRDLNQPKSITPAHQSCSISMQSSRHSNTQRKQTRNGRGNLYPGPTRVRTPSPPVPTLLMLLAPQSLVIPPPLLTRLAKNSCKAADIQRFIEKTQEIDSASRILARPACARQVPCSPRSLCCWYHNP